MSALTRDEALTALREAGVSLALHESEPDPAFLLELGALAQSWPRRQEGHMTGPEHYLEAEGLLEVATKTENGDPLESYAVAAAQVHATLANVYAHNRATTELIALLRIVLDRLTGDEES